MIVALDIKFGFKSWLPEPLHLAVTKSGKRYQLKPGGLRDFMVDIGKHTPRWRPRYYEASQL